MPMLFELDLRRTLTPPEHIATQSGHAVVLPLMNTVCGVADVFSPPLFIRPMRFVMEFELDGRRVIDDGNRGKGDCGLLYAGGTWQVDRIRRNGTYHHFAEGKLFSLQVTSELFALRERAGFALRITVRNRCGRRVELRGKPLLQRACPGKLSLSQWDYSPPAPGVEVKPVGQGKWSSGDVDLTLTSPNLAWTLEPEASLQFSLMLVATPAGTSCDADPDVCIAQTEKAWQERLARAEDVFPRIQTDIPGLADYYNRSLVSGLICLWDRQDFVTNPFVATCGMDGGGICCYPWDTSGYAANSLAMLLGRGLGDHVHAMASFGLDQHSRYAPDGAGRDVPYSYNAYSFINLVYTDAVHRGVNRELYEYAARVFLELESRLTIVDHLADYGVQHNLLEMRQTGYEHFVPSPNAERAWCYQRLADLGDLLGDSRTAAWRKEAADTIAAIREKLWSLQAGFFKCLHPGREELVLTIQGFDAMRMGACTPAMELVMLQHVRDGAFLGEYGVSSVSAEDAIHYELNDPDWSGGGAYTGDGPLLALTLFERGYADAGWDVLRRHFWMGKHLVYYPQEHYCDRPAVPAHKRANVFAGLSGAEAILFGLAGLQPRLDGTLGVSPRWPASLRGNLQLHNVVFRGQRSDITIENGRASVHSCK